MTYSRLFLHLLVAGAILLAGVWWYSFRTFSSIALVSPNHTVMSGAALGTLHCGTLDVLLYPDVRGGGFFDFKSRSISDLPRQERYGLMGRFKIGAESDEGIDSFTVQLPLWLVYLLLTGSGFALMRWGERRSAASAEKAHALENHSRKEHSTP